MKKKIAVLFALALTFSVIGGCGKKEEASAPETETEETEITEAEK